MRLYPELRNDREMELFTTGIFYGAGAGAGVVVLLVIVGQMM